MYKNTIKELKSQFEQVIAKLKEGLASIRTGRASTSLVENIPVTYYGTTAPLKQMATLTIPDPTQIVVRPWDKNALGDIDLAIQNSDLGLSPVNEGNVIRIKIPQLTEQRREELIRNIKRMGEEARVTLRGIRGGVWDEIRKMVNKGTLTEDDKYSAEKELNNIIDEYNRKIEEIIADKEKELKTI